LRQATLAQSAERFTRKG